MIHNTFMIFGPGGIGKSPVDELVHGDVCRVDPYRLRAAGPRDTADIFYAPPALHTLLAETFERLGDQCDRLSTTPMVEWHPKSRVAFFKVREEWQCLFLGETSAEYAKAEIFAPIVPILFQREEIKDQFGRIFIVILNPADPLGTLGGSYNSIQELTRINCQKRGDSEASMNKRVASVAEEAATWAELLKLGAVEFANWEFPEYVYRDDPAQTLREARRRLLAGCPDLGVFLKPESAIV